MNKILSNFFRFRLFIYLITIGRVIIIKLVRSTAIILIGGILFKVLYIGSYYFKIVLAIYIIIYRGFINPKG